MNKALNDSTYRRGPRTHTHPKETGPRGSSFGRAGPGYLPASCGHTDSKPPRWDSNPRPEVHGPRTRPSHHDRRHSAVATITPDSRQLPRSLLFSHHHHGEPPQRTADRSNHDRRPSQSPQSLLCRTLVLTTTLLFLRWEGFLFLATHLLIGRSVVR